MASIPRAGLHPITTFRGRAAAFGSQGLGALADECGEILSFAPTSYGACADPPRSERICPYTAAMTAIPLAEVITLLILGLAAGTAGGLVGIGGSLVIIPVLTLLMDKDQHLAQACAMIVNVFVAVPALLRHHQAKAVQWGVVVRMLPFGLVLILVGVALSDRIDGELLMKLFGVFLLYIIAINVLKLFEDGRKDNSRSLRIGWLPVGLVGSLMGFAAGLLGIGGGPIAVPMLQRICRLPLRTSIATATAVMCVTAAIGAWRKNAGLSDLLESSATPNPLGESLLLAACLVPTAMIGALIGARLTHKLPIKLLRIAFILLMIWASVNMLDLLPSELAAGLSSSLFPAP